MEPLSLTISDTTKATGFGKTTTYRLIKEGRLTAVKIGRRTLVTVASIKALLDQPKASTCHASGPKNGAHGGLLDGGAA